MKKWRKLLSGLKQKVLFQRRPFAVGQLAGHSVFTIPGTLRAKPDMDDAWIGHLAHHYDAIYDIGANIGLTALQFKFQNPKAKLLLVDPNEEALEWAFRNLLKNGMAKGVDFFSGFVSNKPDQKVKFFTVGVGAAGSMYAKHAETASKVDAYLNVATTTLDQLHQAMGWSPHFVKIDVEGAEALVLEGATQLALAAKPVFFIEMHSNPDLDMVTNTNLCLKWAQSVGYQGWYLPEHRILLDGSEVSHRGKYHLLLLPTDQPYPAGLSSIKEGSLS
jgi:FkbM family methyltransferase